MANAQTFGNEFITLIKDLVQDFSAMRVLLDRVAQDNTLLQNYLTVSGRQDISLADLQNAVAVLNQLLASVDAGNPPPKAAIYKVLP